MLNGIVGVRKVQVVAVRVRNSAYMARKGVTKQFICLLLNRDGQGSHYVGQYGVAICKVVCKLYCRTMPVAMDQHQYGV
jgi:hypothetical protein